MGGGVGTRGGAGGAAAATGVGRQDVDMAAQQAMQALREGVERLKVWFGVCFGVWFGVCVCVTITCMLLSLYTHTYDVGVV